MSSGGYIEGGVLVAFGAGLVVNQSRLWPVLDREQRSAVVVRAALPVLLGATALASAAGAPTWVPAVLLTGFVVDAIAIVVLGWRGIRRRRGRPMDRE